MTLVMLKVMFYENEKIEVSFFKGRDSLPFDKMNEHTKIKAIIKHFRGGLMTRCWIKHFRGEGDSPPPESPLI